MTATNKVDRQGLLRSMFEAAIAAAQPALCLPAHLPSRARGRTIVTGAGKASAAMARALEDHWEGPLNGLVVTRYGYSVPCERTEIVEVAHPVPDAAGMVVALGWHEAPRSITRCSAPEARDQLQAVDSYESLISWW